MDDRKVAIVIDNSMQVSKDLSLKISQKCSEVKVFDFSEDEVKEFSFWSFFKLCRLIYKIEKLDLSNFDKVYTLSTGFANGVITNLDTKHINVFLGFPSWYFQSDHFFLKHKIRNWITYATQRAEENYFSYDWIKNSFLKLNKTLKFKNSLSYTNLKLTLNPEKKDYFTLITNTQSKNKFTEECVRIFNQTGKKLYVVGNKSLANQISEFSNYVEFVEINNIAKVASTINSARGLILDTHCYDFEFLQNNLKNSVPVLSYKNGLVNEVFNQDSLFKIEDIDQFENEFAKFISWAKTKLKTKTVLKCLDSKITFLD